MKAFNHVLVAFDGSDKSKDALKTAEYISKLSEARLTIVYVQEPASDNGINPDVMYTGNPDFDDGSVSMTGQSVQETSPSHTVVTELTDDQKPDSVLANARTFVSNLIDPDYQVLSGQPATQIIEYAKQSDVDLIIIGNRGLSGVKKLFMGSVSKKVMKEADCSVLVVKNRH